MARKSRNLARDHSQSSKCHHFDSTLPCEITAVPFGFRDWAIFLSSKCYLPGTCRGQKLPDCSEYSLFDRPQGYIDLLTGERQCETRNCEDDDETRKWRHITTHERELYFHHTSYSHSIYKTSRIRIWSPSRSKKGTKLPSNLKCTIDISWNCSAYIGWEGRNGQ